MTRTSKSALASWYDYPQYFDLAFQSETVREADFIEATCKKYCAFPVRRLFEPACGTGRLVVELARRGYRMAGCDLSEPSLGFLQKQLARKKLQADVILADMADFQLPQPIDAAFNTFNSFRHLVTEELALAHLRCMADAVRPGGIYLLGLHLLPPDASLESTERWTERKGTTQVTTTFRVTSANLKQRLENIRVSLLVRRTGRPDLRLRDEFPLRLYNATQMRHLLKKSPLWKVRDIYDFWYDIDQPLRLTNDMSDTVFVLQRHG